MSRIARTIYDSMLLTLAPLCFAGDGPSGEVSVGGSSGELDFEHLELCLAGPGFDLSPGCYPYDLDADDDCDLRDVWDVQHVLCGPELLVYTIGDENDDGTETIPRRWDSDGYGADGWNRLGTSNPELYLAGLRFRLPDVQPGEDFVYARLLLPGGHAAPAGVVRLRVYGVDDDSASEFHLAPPSLPPHTDQSVYWEEPGPWPAGATDCVPLWRPSPNLAPVVNAVINRPQWGAGAGGRVLGLLIEPDLAAGEGYLTFRDFVADPADCSGGPAGARLELYRTVRSTFLGRELLGRPTDHSVTINALSLLTLHVYAEYGTSPGVYSAQTPVGVYPGGEPIEFTLSGLSPATRYYYRLRYRRPDESTFESGPEHTFRTQADTGESFRFAVIADPHVLRSRLSDLYLRRRLYETTLTNIAAEQPDFFLDLGDSMNSEEYDSRDALDALEAVRRHIDQRPMLDLVAHSAPYFLVLGNHEGEQGWRLDGTPDNLAVWATLARKAVYPLPTSDGFYTGNSLLEPFVGLRENYYAWR